MQTEERLRWPVQALAAIREFHALRSRREISGGLRVREAERFFELRDIFEPKRVAGSGVRRVPIKMSVRWTAVVFGPGNERQEGEIVRLSLRKLEVDLHHPLPVGVMVHLIIAGPRAHEWVQFTGSIVELNTATNHATVAIASAKCLDMRRFCSA